MRNYHKSVLTKEVLKSFGLDRAHSNYQAWYIDATLGHAGHSLAIINAGGKVLGIEEDIQTLEIANERLNKACPAVVNKQPPYVTLHGNFSDIDLLVKKANIENVRGILYDLGVNNDQLVSTDRGFSFNSPEALLDMRIDRDTNKVTASDLLNALREDQLVDLFSEVLTQFEAKKLAGAVIKRRKYANFQYVSDFLETCDSIFPKKSKIHPATRAFLALRIAVNSELDALKNSLEKGIEILKPEAVVSVISFHSGEDILVKNIFKEWEKGGKGEILTKKPITPGIEEIESNPKARSAKLRTFRKK